MCIVLVCTHIGYEVGNELDAQASVLDLSINPFDAMGISRNECIVYYFLVF